MELKKMYPNAEEDNRYYLVLNPLESTMSQQMHLLSVVKKILTLTILTYVII